jgi:hypothetical protein
MAFIGVPPSAGAATPEIAAMLTTEGGEDPVSGNSAVTTPEFAVFVADAPATVKKFATTPERVNPCLATRFMVAV